jgi:hypothetical protein
MTWSQLYLAITLSTLVLLFKYEHLRASLFLKPTVGKSIVYLGIDNNVNCQSRHGKNNSLADMHTVIDHMNNYCSSMLDQISFAQHTQGFSILNDNTFSYYNTQEQILILLRCAGSLYNIALAMTEEEAQSIIKQRVHFLHRDIAIFVDKHSKQFCLDNLRVYLMDFDYICIAGEQYLMPVQRIPRCSRFK